MIENKNIKKHLILLLTSTIGFSLCACSMMGSSMSNNGMKEGYLPFSFHNQQAYVDIPSKAEVFDHNLKTGNSYQKSGFMLQTRSFEMNDNIMNAESASDISYKMSSQDGTKISIEENYFVKSKMPNGDRKVIVNAKAVDRYNNEFYGYMSFLQKGNDKKDENVGGWCDVIFVGHKNIAKEVQDEMLYMAESLRGRNMYDYKVHK